MKLDDKIKSHDFVVVIRPHVSKDKRWTGEVSVKCVLDERNPLSDEEFEEFSNSILNGDVPSGGSDDTPTGGGGIDVGNLPDNMDGKSSSGDSKSKSSVQLSDRQKDLLKKKIEKQKKFLDGDIQKTSISKSDSKNLNAIEESGSEIKEVGKDDGESKRHSFQRSKP